MKINKINVISSVLVVLIYCTLIQCTYGLCDGCSSDRSSDNFPPHRPDYTENITNTRITRSIIQDPFDELWGENVTPGIVLGIVSPLGYPQVYQEGPINFEAFVFGGNPPYRFEWTSNIEGIIGRDGKFTAGDLSVNTHEITLVVRDSTGLKVTEGISLKVIPKIPLTASIISPKNITYALGDSIDLIPSVYGGKKPYILIWKLDGKELGEKDVKRIDNLSFGIYEITLEVIDAGTVSVEDRVEIAVVEICNNNGICDHGEDYWNCPRDCSGSANDYCDGIRDGICDPDCLREEDMDCICNRDGICEIDIEDHLSCPWDCPSGSLDGYCDVLEDGRCDPDCVDGMEWADPDCEGDGWFSYLVLLILVMVLIVLYSKFIRR